MENTQTPISERTDEQLVRTIAEWMGIDLSQARWSNPNTVSKYGYLEHAEHRWIFRPHADIPEGAADRERVMLAMPMGISFEFYDHESDGRGVDIIQGHKVAHSVAATTLGRAFCEAVVAWIETQGEGSKR